MSKIYDKEYGLPSQYLLNKKKRPAETDGKYLYYYVGASISDFPKGSKLKKYKNAYVCELEVSLEEWQCLVELDKAEYNVNHKEDRYQDSYQTVESFNGLEEISEDVELSTVLGIDKEILSLHKQGYTQQEIAEELKVTQGYVSKRLIKIKDKIEDGESAYQQSRFQRYDNGKIRLFNADKAVEFGRSNCQENRAEHNLRFHVVSQFVSKARGRR